MSRIEGCSSPPSYVPLRNRNHCHGSTLIPYLQQTKQKKREKPRKHWWEKEQKRTSPARYYHPPPPSLLFQFYLPSRVNRVSTSRHGSRGKGVPLLTSVFGAMLFTSPWKKKKKKIRKGEKGEGTKGEGIEEKVTKGVDSPLFFLRANNNKRRPASFKILKHDCTGCMQGGALPFKPFSNHRGANSIDAKKTQKLAYTLQIIPQLY